MHNLLESSNVKFASVATDIRVHHYKRVTAAGLWKQMHAFAVGRARLGRRDRTFLRPSHVSVAFGVPAILLILSVGGLVMPMIWFCAGTAAGVGMAFFFATAVRCSVSATVLAIPAMLIAGTAWITGFLREWLNPPERAERKS